MRSYKPVVMTVATLSIFPFVLATYFSLANTPLFGKTGVTLFATYGAVVLSLLSGIIWGRVIELPENLHGRKLLICCNLLLLTAWGSLLMNTPELSVVLLLLGFVSIYWVEARWLKPSNAHKPYLSMHFSLTSVVCIMHLLVLYPHY